MVIQKVSLDKEIDDTGLIKIDSVLTNIGYREHFEKATSNIDIVHNYARTWTTNNFDFIRNTVMNKSRVSFRSGIRKALWICGGTFD